MRRIAFILLALACALPAHAGKRYTYDRVGNANDVAPLTTRGVVLMGGGTEVDSSMQQMCAWASNGDFLVIRATGTDAYNPYLDEICPDLNSVATLIIPSRSAAADPFVEQTILAAEAIWIAGGAQDDYINYWTDTPVQQALNDSILLRGVPIGGTSAGLAVLTQYVYSALGSKGVTSAQALADPYNRYVTLARDFVALPALTGIIGDTHFVTRDRMGRALAFLCRITNEGWDARGAIAVDEETALEIPSQGPATVASNRSDGSVYFLSPTEPAQYCEPKTPLTFRNVDVHRVGADGTFDLASWTGFDGTAYQVSAVEGILSSTQANESIY